VRANDVTAERLRFLAARRPPHGKVLSLFLDLTPSEFATPAARSSAIGSLLNEARRCVEDADLDHDVRAHLRGDLERVAGVLDPATLPADGAAGLAVFASEPADLLEVLRLPRSVPTRAFLDDAPHVEPLADVAVAGGVWCAALVSRGAARFFFGPPEALVEERVGDFHQDRFEREVGSEIDAHLRHVAETLERTLHEGRWERLVLGAAHEFLAPLEGLLPADVRQRIAGRFDADVENIAADDVIAHVSTTARRLAETREAELLARFEAGIGTAGGRAAAGLEATLEALHERRVEALLLAAGHRAAGSRCPQCGWLGPQGAAACPADGSALDAREDVIEDAVRATIAQDAVVVHLAEPDGTPLGPHRVGAVLRF
jgi:peptide chain release factor subunit 1